MFSSVFNRTIRFEKKQDQVKYAEIILDFSYFKISEAQEKRIEESSVSWVQKKNNSEWKLKN